MDMEKYALGSVIILDIEGTTTPISFVADVLFPYAREKIPVFIKNNWTDPELVEIINRLRQEVENERTQHNSDIPLISSPENNESEEVIDSVIENLFWQMDRDRKAQALKMIQGKIWKEGFHSGLITSEIFPDVPEAMDRWSKNGKKIFIYSSGSVEAQILLFGHTSYGNLLHYISGNFDTAIGSKLESQSYKTIADHLGEDPTNITFFTDSLKEAEAATASNWKVVLMKRPGNPVIEDPIPYQIESSFNKFN